MKIPGMDKIYLSGTVVIVILGGAIWLTEMHKDMQAQGRQINKLDKKIIDRDIQIRSHRKEDRKILLEIYRSVGRIEGALNIKEN